MLVRLSIFSQLSILQYIHVWGCVFSLYPFPLWWLREYTLCLIIIIKSEVWTITHCLGLGHETMVCVVCLSILLRMTHFTIIHSIFPYLRNTTDDMTNRYLFGPIDAYMRPWTGSSLVQLMPSRLFGPLENWSHHRNNGWVIASHKNHRCHYC